MGNTPRERLLIMLLPALIVVGGYVLGYARDKELEAARAGLETARKSEVPYMDVVDAQEKVDEANAKLAQVKKQKSELEARWRKLGSVHNREAHDRNHAVKEVSRMLRDRGLHSIDESMADDELPPSFQSVLTQLNGDQPPQSSRRLLKIRVVGRYAEVLEALESLRDSGSPVIPISLSMSDIRPDTPYRSWILLLWI
jgi:hypothetical protein